MAKIAAPKVESEGGSFEARQIVRLSAGLYGGMLAWYSNPKMYPVYNPKPGKPTQEEKFYCGFVVTNDRTNAILTDFSEAMIGVRPKRFYSEETGMKSTYVALLYALMGGKLSLQEIAEMPDEDLPDFDDLIGRPAVLFIEPNSKADNNGLYGHKVKSLEPVDKGLWAAVKPLYDAKETARTEDGRLRLASPKGVYEDEAVGGTGGFGPQDGSAFDDEPPF